MGVTIGKAVSEPVSFCHTSRYNELDRHQPVGQFRRFVRDRRR
ncbi:hypothetical protein [Nonomuraea basaltis]|nr:hypothetical protein [Nonomuraea basaltis]